MQVQFNAQGHGVNQSGSVFRPVGTDEAYPNTYSLDEMVEAIRNNKQCIIDDHVHYEVQHRKVYGVAMISTVYGREHVVQLIEDTPCFSFNGLYIDDEDNLPHVSTWSVGGVWNERHHPDVRLLKAGDFVGDVKILSVHWFE
jgi:hypothetical protein